MMQCIIIYYLLYCIDDGETGGLRPNKGDRFVELQHQTDTESARQLQDQAR